MDFVTLTVHTTSEAADIVSLILIEEGSEGTNVVDKSDIDFVKQHVYWDYAPDFVFPSGDEVTVTGYFESNKNLDDVKSRIIQLKSSELNVGSLAFDVDGLDSADYENEWKKYYQIMEIGGVAIVPEWLEYSGSLPFLLMNPGKAFGTGGHETTAMCLELMQEFPLNGSFVLDVGCGSGILGLAALKLGAKRAQLTDIDIQAVESAQSNALINGLEGRASVTCADVIAQPIKEQADIVLANLTADVLILLQPSIKTMVKKGGAVVISGIINQRLEDVIKAFSGFRFVKSQNRGEWNALSFIVD